MVQILMAAVLAVMVALAPDGRATDAPADHPEADAAHHSEPPGGGSSQADRPDAESNAEEESESADEPAQEAVRPTLILTPAQAQMDRQYDEMHQIESVDDLLRALERRNEGLRSLRARIRYTKFFPFEGDEQVRSGTLYFMSLDGDPPVRKFAVHFDTLEFDGRLERGEERSYIFDGQWLVERLPKERQIFKRQVVPPGERFDPLRLGEGPFPIPIGQKREEILERFEAELLPSEDGTQALDKGVRAWLLDERVPTWQLRLVPREGYEDELELAEIRLWYRRSDLLPRAAWTRAVNGNESTIQLIGQEVNGSIPADRLDTSVPEIGWNVEITPWRGSLHPEDPR